MKKLEGGGGNAKRIAEERKDQMKKEKRER
jgi:hypothetical protein